MSARPRGSRKPPLKIPKTAGETTYEKFKRLIDALPHDYQQKNFMSRIIACFATIHDLEMRDILDQCYKDVLQKAERDAL